MAKIYAVRKGRVPGLYNTWEECREQVDGFSGAEFKSFATTEQAQAYLDGTPPASGLGGMPDDPATMTAYVDGSYNEKTQQYAFGLVILARGEKRTFNGVGTDSAAASMRNVAGEILGAVNAMAAAYSEGFKTLHLFFDYQGIEAWCTGTWKAKNENTQQFRKTYQHFRELGLAVHFHKVKAHTGNRYNEEADRLAKAAIGIE